MIKDFEWGYYDNTDEAYEDIQNWGMDDLMKIGIKELNHLFKGGWIAYGDGEYAHAFKLDEGVMDRMARCFESEVE